jgi:hypothetical protein
MRRIAWVIVIAAALLYPLAVVAGGAPKFPSRSDCVVPARTDGDVDLVFGYHDSTTRAATERDRLRALGYVRAEVVSDGGCGRLKVAVEGYPTLAGARDAAEEARRSGLAPTLEQGR